MKKILLLFSLIFLIGCGSSSSENEVSTQHPLNPKAIFSNLKINNSMLEGTLQLKELNNFYSNVSFSNIKINSEKCNFPSVEYSSNSIKNNETLTFKADISGCNSNINSLTVSFRENATYMDTNLKNISKFFTQTVDVSSELNLSNTSQVEVYPTKLIIIPYSITMTGGSKYNIKILTLDNNNRGVSSTVLISHPIDSSNRNWGSFDKYSITTNENGEGEVTFTAVNNIENLNNELKVPFTIQSTGLQAYLVLSKPSSTNELTSYKINYNAPDSVAIEKNFNINIQVLNGKNEELVDSDKIKQIDVSSENHLVYFDNNSSKFKTTLLNNNINVYATSSKISGIEIVNVKAIINENGVLKTVSTQIPIVIISGPVSAISINSIGSSFNKENGLFERTFAIHAVDRYSNPVQAGTKITVGAVINKKISGTNGEIVPIANADYSEFKDGLKNFSNDLLNNTLIVIGNAIHKDPLYLGGWIVDSIKDVHTLQLASTYSGETTTGLSYVIGDEKRFNSCDSTLALADFDSANKVYQTDNNGIAIVKLRFDPYLIGKTVALYANSYQDKRVGVSIKEVLFNNELITFESNEDENTTQGDNIWEKSANANDNVDGIIYIGTNGGNINTKLGNDTTLATNTPVTLKVLTPSICSFSNGNDTYYATSNCNGGVSFRVSYLKTGTCKVNLDGINYEY